MYCDKCGKENSDDAKYCYECGNLLVSETINETSSEDDIVLEKSDESTALENSNEVSSNVEVTDETIEENDKQDEEVVLKKPETPRSSFMIISALLKIVYVALLAYITLNQKALIGELLSKLSYYLNFSSSQLYSIFEIFSFTLIIYNVLILVFEVISYVKCATKYAIVSFIMALFINAAILVVFAFNPYTLIIAGFISLLYVLEQIILVLSIIETYRLNKKK